MSNARQKGLNFVREVRKILESKGYKIEGPGYGCAFYGGAMKPIHRDYFGVFDLISYKAGFLRGHQVSTLTNKASKVKALMEANIAGDVWCRISKGNYRLFCVDDDGEEEMFLENI